MPLRNASALPHACTSLRPAATLAVCLGAALVSGPAVTLADTSAVTPGAGTAESSTPSPEELKARLLAKMEEISRQQRELQKQLAEVEKQRQEVELLVNQVADLDRYRGGADASAPGTPPPEVAADRKAERTAQQEEVPELPRVSQEIGGVLTPKGRLIIEPSFQYLYSSVNRVSVEGFTIPGLLIGLLDVVELDRDLLVAAVTARYGLTDRLEVEMKVPYVYRRDTSRTRETNEGGTITETDLSGDGSGMGDIEFDLRYQLPRPSPGWPYMVANLRTKSDTGTDPWNPRYNISTGDLPTGSGFWTFNPSLTFIYPTDPVVFFGNVGYLWTLEDRKGTQTDANTFLGDVDPGDAVRLNFGMGLGLNDRSSFSISYSLDIFNRTEYERLSLVDLITRGSKLPGSDVTVGKLLIGYSLRMPGGTPLNLAIGLGATEDAPDTDVTFRIPFKVLD